MQQTTLAPREPPPTLVTPWSLHAWPLLLWQAGQPARVRFHHLCTRITFTGDPPGAPAGQTIWRGSAADGEAGMAWDWILISRGIVAMADPMSVITNLRLVGEQGEVLTAHQSARYLNEIVRALPWQSEVQRALGARTH